MLVRGDGVHFVERGPARAAGGQPTGVAGSAFPVPSAVRTAGAVPPVVLLHGQPGEVGHWDPVVESISGRYRVLACDRPGYGKSGGDAIGIWGNASVIAEELARRQATPAVVVGHSFGGGVALAMAIEHPRTVAALVLVGSIGGQGHLGIADRLLGAPLLGDALTAFGMPLLSHLLPVASGLVEKVPGEPGRRLSAALPDAGLARLLDGRPGLWRSVVAEQRAMLRELPELARRVGEVDVPTVVVVGAWDSVVPPTAQRALAARIKGAELVEIPDIGHFVQHDAPGSVAEAVDAVVQAV